MSDTLNAGKLLNLIFSYITKISSTRNHDKIIDILANMSRELTEADRCTIWLVSDDKKSLWTKVAHGIDNIVIPINSGIVGSAVTQRKRVIIDDAYEDERFNKTIDLKTGYRTKSIMVVPMHNQENIIIGAIQVINKKNNGVFDKRDLERLLLASTYAAESIESSLLLKEIEQTQSEIILTMGAVGESRSKETGNHVKRVAEYSYLLAKKYGLSENEALLLKEASPMHDIGKIGIPDAILNKPGRFNDEERKTMDTHASIGYKILKDSTRKILSSAAIVAYEHHEKWDGTGYPRALKGEQIHIFGRITALADVFDALGSDRVYKRAWSDEKIFALLKDERGKHFDPKLVDIFFDNLDEFLKIREKHKDEYNG